MIHYIWKNIWTMEMYWRKYCVKRRVKKNEKKLEELVKYATKPDDELTSGMTGYQFDRGFIACFSEIKSEYVKMKETERNEEKQIHQLEELWHR